jgi:hypothetical protein
MPNRPVPAKTSSKAVAQGRSKPASKTTAKLTPEVKAKPHKHQKTSKNDVKPKKSKMVRDSFNMPESDYILIALIKKRCVARGLAVKKSEVLRAAIIGFASQSDEYIKASMEALEVIKTGRPPKGRR